MHPHTMIAGKVGMKPFNFNIVDLPFVPGFLHTLHNNRKSFAWNQHIPHAQRICRHPPVAKDPKWMVNCRSDCIQTRNHRSRDNIINRLRWMSEDVDDLARFNDTSLSHRDSTSSPTDKNCISRKPSRVCIWVPSTKHGTGSGPAASISVLIVAPCAAAPPAAVP